MDKHDPLTATKLLITIPHDWTGKTVESFLKQHEHFSRSRIRDLKKNQAITINNKVVWATDRLAGGETLQITLSTIAQDITPENIPLDILHEDADIAVIHKPAGMIVHPIGVYQNGTLANALIHHWQSRRDSAAFHPVHRLDRQTSGLIIVAKNSWAHQQLDRQLNSGMMRRLYLAICKGNFPDSSCRIDAPLKLIGPGFRWGVADDGKPSLTRIRTITQFSNSTLLAVKLYTGRTHQIRVHLSSAGFPLRGDYYYGESDPLIDRPALHSAGLWFIHPRNHQWMKFRAKLPADMVQLIGSIENGECL